MRRGLSAIISRWGRRIATDADCGHARRAHIDDNRRRLDRRAHAGVEGLRIEVNGEVRQTAATTILGLVQELSLNPAKVAVERNLEIVPRSLHGETALAEGDRIELVQFVGGG